MFYTPHKIFGLSIQEEGGVQSTWHLWGWREMSTGVCWGNMRERPLGWSRYRWER